MQTFIVSYNSNTTAKILDRQRLGKQRVEAIQIARIHLGLSSGWENHPAVKRWKNYLPYLIKVYIPAMLFEWEMRRGYKNTKSIPQWRELYEKVRYEPIIIPKWITDELILSHKSNLVRKKSEYYRRFFPDVPDNLPYVW